MHTVLTIAGFDPSGGAGILADIKTIAAFGCYGAAAITSITSQNTMGVYETFHQPSHILSAQLEPVFDDFTISAIKIGMLPTPENIDLVVETLIRRKSTNIVVDPVITSTSGFDLINRNNADYLMTHLFPIANLITPNVSEAEILAGISITNIDDMKVAARAIYNNCFKSDDRSFVLVKGGDLQNVQQTEAIDILFDGDGFQEFVSEKIPSRNTHGTGCTLSSAVASMMAMGADIPAAIEKAKAYVVSAILKAPDIGHGHGPLNHFF